VRPVIVPEVAEPLTSGLKLLKEASTLVKAYWYRVMGAPTAGTVQFKVAIALPGLAVTPVGALGTTFGRTVTLPEGAPLLMSFTALTTTV
jgi:hypothetical protein